MNAGCACEIPWECVPYLSTLEMWSRQGTIKIHVYLTFNLRHKNAVSFQNTVSSEWLRHCSHCMLFIWFPYLQLCAGGHKNIIIKCPHYTRHFCHTWSEDAKLLHLTEGNVTFLQMLWENHDVNFHVVCEINNMTDQRDKNNRATQITGSSKQQLVNR